MQRLTAKALLLALLVSIFSPAALTMAGANPHACCLRRMHNQPANSSRFNAPVSRSNNCCPPMASTSSAEVGSPVSGSAEFATMTLGRVVKPLFAAAHVDFAYSGRAPPSQAF